MQGERVGWHVVAVVAVVVWLTSGWPAAAGGHSGRRRGQQLVHEGDVGDGQPQRLDPGQALLVGKGGHLHKDTRLQS